MSSRRMETETENERNGSLQPGRVNTDGCQVAAQPESNLTRFGQKLKRWYTSNANFTFIPDIHLMIDDDHSRE